MLSILNKFILIIMITFFVSCTKRKHYQNVNYNNSNYKKINNHEIKNSKAMHRATMRSYVVHGKRYYPTKTYSGETFEGVASWYGPNFHAKKTSNGEIYDMYASTAASKTLPMNTMLYVYNKDNGKSTIVRINDRGPFVSGRIIDLSNKAAHEIDMVKNGTANIKIKVIGFDAKIAKTTKEKEDHKYSINYYLQVGVFSKLLGAKTTMKKFNNILDNSHKAFIRQDTKDNKRINRVLIRGFRSKQEALDYKEEIGINNAIIIAQ